MANSNTSGIKLQIIGGIGIGSILFVGYHVGIAEHRLTTLEKASEVNSRAIEEILSIKVELKAIINEQNKILEEVKEMRKNGSRKNSSIP